MCQEPPTKVKTLAKKTIGFYSLAKVLGGMFRISQNRQVVLDSSNSNEPLIKMSGIA
ncbi:MAG: hypothetical protein QT03_C0001G0975 [archaeon GW2011_AR10]|nr:MAG: hypothetical protein QT03_C0001G0975 [archaeon GW2011_AR10]